MSVDRSLLTSRNPPSMTLSDGSATSMTPAPKPLPSYSTSSNPSTAAERAAARFHVGGNAIVTGGSGGIGSVTCRALLEHGVRGLAIFDLSPQETQATTTIKKLQSDFPEANIIFIPVDVTDGDTVTAAVAEVESRLHGPVNTLLCFAGITGSIHALDMSPQEWRKMFDVNTTGTFLCAQAVARTMMKRRGGGHDGGGGGGGSIILMASISAHVANFPQPQVHYNASKCAILSMKSSLAAEWARYGIRVNSISPGYMDTILNEGAGLEEHRRTWRQRIPFGRMGQPEELAGAVILLASQAGSYMTGVDILVDGGLTIF